jgi:hypothetical protein
MTVRGHAAALDDAVSERLRAMRSGRARVSRYFSDPVLFAREVITWPDGEGLAPLVEEVGDRT